MDKEAIKKDLLDGSNTILEKYGEYELVDSISVMNMAAKTVFLGSLRVHNEDNVKRIKDDLKKEFKNYGDLAIRDEKVVPCCAPKYVHISFNVSITN
ncbi:hypothetical protein [Methanobrevibacter sp.]|uniref:hypothetical protein n=1 Tax=Methanobrevibacter sp. TaxID=66852 RepID=UPI00388D8794